MVEPVVNRIDRTQRHERREGGVILFTLSESGAKS